MPVVSVVEPMPPVDPAVPSSVPPLVALTPPVLPADELPTLSLSMPVDEVVDGPVPSDVVGGAVVIDPVVPLPPPVVPLRPVELSCPTSSTFEQPASRVRVEQAHMDIQRSEGAKRMPPP
jgi:hypothetical protein